MHKTVINFAVLFLLSFSLTAREKYTLSGTVKDAETGDPLIGASVYVEGQTIGGSTDIEGRYSFALPRGEYTIVYEYVGYKEIKKTVMLNGDREINVALKEEAETMEEVEIRGEKPDKNVEDPQMSTVELDMEQVKKMPALFGEPDVVKNIQMQPGVVSAGEGSSSFFVRGGGADQNLILLDNAPVYNISHFFGLFSVFNSDIISKTKLYKGGIPARFGGRLSSVLDIETNKGSYDEYSGHGSVGLLAAKAMVEGPIQKGKSSFSFSARRSYADVFFPLFEGAGIEDDRVYFHDFNGTARFKLDSNNLLYFGGYRGRDVFKFGDDFRMDWGNTAGTIRWQHIFSDNFFLNSSAVFSNYDYGLNIKDPTQGFNWTSYIRNYTLREDFTWIPDSNHTLSFGLKGSYRSIQPGIFEPDGERSIFNRFEMQEFHAMDYAVYAGNEHKISPKISLEYGLRFSLFSQLGPATIYDYEDPLTNADPAREDSSQYSSGEIITSFLNPEPRFSARYKFNEQQSIKASYNRMVQNVHQMITGTTPLPLSVWRPSTPNINPQKADQWAVGYFRNFKDNTYETSLEVYYKDMRNVIDFDDNATVFFNEDLPAEIRAGNSWSYGAELLVKKVKGDLTGWLSYTWSRTMRNIKGVNQGRTYPASYDRRHSANLALTYDLNKKWDFGLNWTYGSGRPITLPSGRYRIEHYNVSYFTERNGYRLPDFHHLDLSATLTPEAPEDRGWYSEWKFSVYNAYNRKNPFTLFTRNKNDQITSREKEAVMIYLFPVLPSVSYHVNF